MIQAIIFTSTSCPLTPFSKPLNPIPHFPVPRFLPAHIIPIPSLRRNPKINASFDETYGGDDTNRVDNRAVNTNFSFDSFLSVVEYLSLASSLAISVYAALGRNGAVLWGSSKVLAWQCVLLVSGVCVGAAIRRRQWRRACGAAGIPVGSYRGINLTDRVEKLEEDLRGAATIIRVLSRQIEKLGIRVRATRKALKEPISETASLAQKNSEVTRALAVQEDILEKELGETQKVLLAMQEQQQKQLELILAIGKAGKLWETKRLPTKDHNATETSTSLADGGVPNMEIKRN